MSGYLRPTAPIAANALLVADPGAAMALAQVVLDKPLMANHHHGLWGYSGTTSDDLALTVQSTGIGGPSTAAVVAELAGHGVKRVIRLGACTALGPLADGTVVAAGAALGLDGTSVALGAHRPLADPALTAQLAEALGAEHGIVAGYDLSIADASSALRADWLAAGAHVADLETAAFLAVAERAGLAGAAALIVGATDEPLIELGARAAGVLQPG